MVVGRAVEVLPRTDRQELDTPLAIGHHLAAEGPGEEVVAAATVRLPSVDHRMPDGLAFGVFHLQDDQERIELCVQTEVSRLLLYAEFGVRLTVEELLGC